MWQGGGWFARPLFLLLLCAGLVVEWVGWKMKLWEITPSDSLAPAPIFSNPRTQRGRGRERVCEIERECVCVCEELQSSSQPIVTCTALLCASVVHPTVFQKLQPTTNHFGPGAPTLHLPLDHEAHEEARPQSPDKPRLQSVPLSVVGFVGFVVWMDESNKLTIIVDFVCFET